jgi:16S rRNA (cytidine1402-2'-O)-methyltransferase
MTPTEAPVGRLVVCPTPIGNLEDVTLRVLTALREADVVACEDTRHTKRLLERHGIATRTASLHEHNERARAAELVQRIRDGAVVALVSDAGTPLISDPGFALVHACLAAQFPLEVLPGPSAVVTALVASGLSAARWRFVGFLPRARGELTALLDGATETLVAFESPKRLAATLQLLAARDPQREVAVCRELTKLHEEVRRGPVAALSEYYSHTPARGEVALVVGPAAPASASLNDALAVLRELIDAGAKARPAAAAVAKLTGLRANELYRGMTDRAGG